VRCALADPTEPSPPPADGSARAMVTNLAADHSTARFIGPWGSLDVRLPLIGRHNLSNALLAAVASHQIADLSSGLCDALADCPTVPGRLEPVTVDLPNTETALPTVLVDYAHTDDALDNVLSAIRPLTTGRLITVFGCGGDRDRSKRPRMAKVVCRWADRVVITSDNPRTEDPLTIIDDALTGVPDDARSRVTIEPDRGVAIDLAITDASAGDVVVIAGKGHEDYQEIHGVRRPFDDRVQAAGVLRRLAASA